MMSTEAYTVCDQGHSHWGTAGAAGIFLKATLASGVQVVLLQHRSPEVHEGDCWGVPGGARNHDESALQAGAREAEEELDYALPTLHLEHEVIVDHGNWSYTTVVAHCDQPFVLRSSYGWETGDQGFRWVPLDEVADLTLHSGLRAALPSLLGVAVCAQSQEV